MGPKMQESNSQRPSRRRAVTVSGIVLGIGLSLVLLIGACSRGDAQSTSGFDASSGQGYSDSVADELGEQEAVGQGTAEREAGGEVAEAGVATGAEPVSVGPRSVILDGTMAIEVEGLEDALAGAREIVERAGGFLADESVDNTQGIDPTATAVYRVPPEAFDSVMEELAGLGEVTAQDIGTRDVTTEVADLDSRLATLDTSIERLRSFLATATDAQAIIELEQELTAREAEAASLEAQRTALADQVDLATISVRFGSEAVAPPVADEPDVGFASGLESGVDAATDVVRSILAALGFLVPFLPVVVALGALVAWQRHRRQSRRLRAEATG